MWGDMNRQSLYKGTLFWRAQPEGRFEPTTLPLQPTYRENFSLGLPTDSFKHPFRALFVWALMNNLLEMSLFLWEFLDYGIATTLIATEVFNSIILNRRFKENEVYRFDRANILIRKMSTRSGFIF